MNEPYKALQLVRVERNKRPRTGKGENMKTKLGEYQQELHDLYVELQSAETDERKLIINRRINFLAFVILRIERREKEKAHKKASNK